jgi:hypothetical protein
MRPIALGGSVESVLEGKRGADRLRVLDSTPEVRDLGCDRRREALVESQQARQVEHGVRDTGATEVNDAQPLIAGIPHKVPADIAVAERTVVAIKAGKGPELGCHPRELRGTHAITKEGVDVRGHSGLDLAERRSPHSDAPRCRRCRFQSQEQGRDLVAQPISVAASQMTEDIPSDQVPGHQPVAGECLSGRIVEPGRKGCGDHDVRTAGEYLHDPAFVKELLDTQGVTWKPDHDVRLHENRDAELTLAQEARRDFGW